MEQKIDLSRTAGELAAYAAQRLVGFEQHQRGDSCRQPETRHEWIRDILRGMAEVCGEDCVPLLSAFDRRLADARGASAVEMPALSHQRHMVQSLGQYASALDRMEGDQRPRLLHVRALLEEVCAYLPWDPEANGARTVCGQVSEQLVRAVAQRPICFTRVLLGGDLDPGGAEFVPGLADDAECVRRTQEFQQLTLGYPERDEWPALCTVYLGGGQRMPISTIDADWLDMQLIREEGDRFLKRSEVRPAGCKQLCVPVHEQIRVLKVEPGRAPEEIDMPNTLDAFQAAVGGDIEVLGLDSDTALICSEEGKLMGLPPNRRVGGDTIAGTFLIAGDADGGFCSLSDEDAAYYARQFAQPLPVYGSPDEPTQWVFHVF